MTVANNTHIHFQKNKLLSFVLHFGENQADKVVTPAAAMMPAVAKLFL
jgi:hypothetical protein